MTISREKLLLRQIEKVKGQLAALGDLRPGSLSTQYNVCGTPGCRCKASPPEKHGPLSGVNLRVPSAVSIVARQEALRSAA